MNLVVRKNVAALFVFVEAFLIVLALVFNVPAHYLKPLFIGIAVLSIPALLLVPAKRR